MVILSRFAVQSVSLKVSLFQDTQDADGKPLLRPLLDHNTYSTYVYSDEAVRHIGRHASGEVSTPFFIYL